MTNQEATSEVQPTKRIRVEEPSETDQIEKATTASLQNVLNDFELHKLLTENTNNRLMVVHAIRKRKQVDANSEQATLSETKQDQDDVSSASAASVVDENRNAVVIFEKPAFSLNETKSFFETNCPFETQLENDIYTKLAIFPDRPYNNVQVQLIYPATPAHLAKYSYQEMFLVNESYADWQQITSPFIKESAFSAQWVYNILEHKTESERILFEDTDPDTGFILLPDIKWDASVVENMYMLAIVHRKDIESLRSLTGAHLPLLENLRDKSLAAIEQKHGVKASKVRAYVHYQPSFYHFHVHFGHIKNEASGMPERNYALNQIIENLKIDANYYQRAALTFVARKNDKLYERFKSQLE